MAFASLRSDAGRSGDYINFEAHKMKTTEPNQSLQTMQFAVTPAASHPSRQQTACLI